jgi:hypothetical protein
MTIKLNKEYQWNPEWHSKITKTDIKNVVRELKQIEDTHGTINGELMVKFAESKKSVLHSYFEWDDTIAAHKWRVHKAVDLLGHIEVKVITDGEPLMMRAFEIVKRASGFDNIKTIGEYSSDGGVLYVSLSITQLKQVIKRIAPYGYSKSISYIEKAIKELETETEKEDKPLKKAV